MSLYKKKEDIETSVSIVQAGGQVNFLFSADCGKFGTDEVLDEFSISNEELFDILRKHEYSED